MIAEREELKPLWLTNSSSGGLMPSASPSQKFPAACTMVGYGQRSTSQSLSRSSDCRVDPPGSVPRWKLWLTTVQCWSRTAQRSASTLPLLAE